MALQEGVDCQVEGTGLRSFHSRYLILNLPMHATKSQMDL